MAGQGFGILLEMWKVTKTVNVRVQPTNGLIPYRIIFEDKHVLSETEAKTKEYDQIAFVPFFPCCKVDKSLMGRRTCIGEGYRCCFRMLCIRCYMRSIKAGIVILSRLLSDSFTSGDFSWWCAPSLSPFVTLLFECLSLGPRIVHQLPSPLSSPHATSNHGLQMSFPIPFPFFNCVIDL